MKEYVPIKYINQEGKSERFATFRLLLSERLMSENRKCNEATDAIDRRRSEEEELHVEPEEDPVIALLESRNKQRVRFCFEDKSNGDSVKFMTVATNIGTDVVNKNFENGNSFNIKAFMWRILYKHSANLTYTEGERKINSKRKDQKKFGNENIWERRDVENFERGNPEVIKIINTHVDKSAKVSFQEDPLLRAKVIKLLDKAQIAQSSHYRYRYALKCYINAHELLSDAKYPENHQLLIKALRLLKNAHHILSCFSNSANIVKMGIKYEESGDLVRALKMYTIAYRIRRDQINCTHPSLLVLLNILGSIQIKRGELQDAMQIYDFALKESSVFIANDTGNIPPCSPSSNLLARAVTFREIGIIQEKWNNPKRALKMYHRSLGCISQWRKKVGYDRIPEVINIQPYTLCKENIASKETLQTSIKSLQLVKSIQIEFKKNQKETYAENGEMEMLLFDSQKDHHLSGNTSVTEYYNSFFGHKEETYNEVTLTPSAYDSYSDIDASLTLHQIGQMHRRQGEFGKSLDAYGAALRGMKQSLGRLHPNVAAILGNIGNLRKELGDFDGAYETYQEVLAIESYLMGVTHPEVATSLHNIATIEVSRGNLEAALAIYKKVINLQRKLFNCDNISVATTSASMGDVYERLGDLAMAVGCYEESLRVKIAVLGRHNIQIARLFHKLGNIAFAQEDFHFADSYTSRALMIYRINKIADDHEWLISCKRDLADIDGAVALGVRQSFHY